MNAMRDSSPGEVSRRAFLRRTACGGAAVGVTAWAAPAILQTVSAGAAAGSTPPVPDGTGVLGEPPAAVSPDLPTDPLPLDLPAQDLPSLSGTEPGARVLGETVTRASGAGGSGE
ncbi:MAG: twin-arginine translocation signal domain-containing protein, partial [Acidimicrobiales bacterium]